jgi:hypothetical protein
MPKFQVSLREVGYREIDVEAGSWQEAKRIVEEGLWGSDYDNPDCWPAGVTASNFSLMEERVDMIQAVSATTAAVVYREGQAE